MSYRIRVAEKVRRKVANWGLPERAREALPRRLDELMDRPSRILIRVDGSPHALQTDVVIHDPGPPARDHLIALSVRYGVDEETLYIVDCDRLVEERRPEPRNPSTGTDR
jgi:hypothetical protein